MNNIESKSTADDRTKVEATAKAIELFQIMKALLDFI